MGFFRFALHNLRRHAVRSGLTLLGIATSVAVLFSILSFSKGFNRGLERELDRTGLHFMIVPSGCPHEVASLVLHGSLIPKFLDLSVMEQVAGIGGVAIASPILVGQLPNPERDKIDLVYGLEMSKLNILKPQWEIDGAVPAQSDDVIMGSELAGHLGIRPGDAITYPLLKRRFTVSGILRKTGSQDDAFLYMDVKTAQEIFNKPAGATAIGVRLEDPAQMTPVIDALTEKVPGIQIVTMNQVMNSIANLAASARALSLSVALIAILVSSVGVMNSMLMAVFERSQEIGMMRAIGASRSDVFRIVLNEALILAVVGGGAGIVVSVVGGGAIESFVRMFMPYVPAGTVVSFDAAIAAGSLLFITFIGTIAGLYPALRASSITPIEAMKS